MNPTDKGALMIIFMTHVLDVASHKEYLFSEINR